MRELVKHARPALVGGRSNTLCFLGWFADVALNKQKQLWTSGLPRPDMQPQHTNEALHMRRNMTQRAPTRCTARAHCLPCHCQLAGKLTLTRKELSAYRVRARQHHHLSRIEALLSKVVLQLLRRVSSCGQVDLVSELGVDSPNLHGVRATPHLGEAICRRKGNDVSQGEGLSCRTFEGVLDLQQELHGIPRHSTATKLTCMCACVSQTRLGKYLGKRCLQGTDSALRMSRYKRARVRATRLARSTSFTSTSL
jgi:hypothetical protein